MKAYKKVLAILIAASMSCSLFAMNISAAEDTKTEDTQKTVLSIDDIENKEKEQEKSDTKTEEKSETTDKTTETTDKTKGKSNVPPVIQKMMTVLKTFEIIPDYYDYNIPLSNEVSRADFAASVARMMGKTEYEGTNVYFYDVPKNYWAFNEISNLTEMGIISGSDEKVFNPGDSITKAAAYKIILCAMGYREYSERAGGYPKGYTTVASSIKLSRGVSGSDKVTLSDMLYILYNALSINIMELGDFSGTSITFKASEDETLISTYRNIYYDEGDVNGANTITISGGTLDAGTALIDSETYYSGTLNMTDYLGEKVEFFYEKDATSDDRTLLWVGHKETSQNVTYISVDGDADLDTNTFVYTYTDTNGKTRRITLEKSLVLIYNGGIVDSGYDTILNNQRYELKLISNKDKHTMIVKQAVNYVVANINSASKVVYDKNVSKDQVNLNPEDYDTFSLKLMGKDDMEFEDIKKDSVLTVYLSKDEKHIEVDVSINTANGTIEKIYTEGYTTLTINGDDYRVDNRFTSVGYSVGDDVTGYLNVNGEIVYLVIKTGTVQGAFLLQANLDKREETLYVKLLGEDSKVKKYTCAEKLIIDGTKYTDVKTAYKKLLFGETKLTAQFALIKKNKDGEITHIDTTRIIESPSSLQIDVPFEMSASKKLIRASSSAARIGEKIVFDANTKVFVVPNVTDYDNVSESDLWVTVGSKLTSDILTYAQSYRMSSKIGVTSYVLLKDYDPSTANTDIPIVAQKITYGMDEYGTMVEILEGYQGSTTVTVQADENASDVFSKAGILPGDIVTITRDSYGKVKSCSIVYDYRTDTHAALTGLNEAMGMFAGYAYDVVDNVVKIGYTGGDEFDFAINAMSTPVLLYDTTKTKNAISKATTSDIITYENDPANCSTVFIVTSRMQPKLFVIFK